jgi:hypothetical protein
MLFTLGLASDRDPNTYASHVAGIIGVPDLFIEMGSC